MADGETVCFGCHQPFQAKLGLTYTVEALSHRWHSRCLKCAKCSKGLWDQELFEVKGQPYCKECSGGGAKVTCKGCQKDVEGTFVNAYGFKWHQACIVCATCKKPIVGTDGFFDDDINLPVHLKCLK